MYYVYEDHLSGKFYITNNEQSYEERYCEQCGDSDWLVKEFKTEKEANEYIESDEYGSEGAYFYDEEE